MQMRERENPEIWNFQVNFVKLQKKEKKKLQKIFKTKKKLKKEKLREIFLSHTAKAEFSSLSHTRDSREEKKSWEIFFWFFFSFFEKKILYKFFSALKIFPHFSFSLFHQLFFFFGTFYLINWWIEGEIEIRNFLVCL